MSRPEHGADSACTTCQGRGSVMGGDQPRSCPSCHRKVECGSCGRMVERVHSEMLDNGRSKWIRCVPCKDLAEARYAEAVAS